MSKRAKCMRGSEVIQMIFNMTDTDEGEDSDDSDSDRPVDGLPSDTEDNVSVAESNQSSDDDANEVAQSQYQDTSAGPSIRGVDSARGRGQVGRRGRGRGRRQTEDRHNEQVSPVHMKAKSGRSWTSQSPAIYRRSMEDIIRCKPGVTAEARIKTEREA